MLISDLHSVNRQDSLEKLRNEEESNDGSSCEKYYFSVSSCNFNHQLHFNFNFVWDSWTEIEVKSLTFTLSKELKKWTFCDKFVKQQ